MSSAFCSVIEFNFSEDKKDWAIQMSSCYRSFKTWLDNSNYYTHTEGFSYGSEFLMWLSNQIMKTKASNAAKALNWFLTEKPFGEKNVQSLIIDCLK